MPAKRAARLPVLIVTGPPAAGKTTVARLLARRLNRAVHLELDWFFHAHSHWLPDTVEARGRLVVRAATESALIYAADNFTIIDGVLSPGNLFQQMATRFRDRGLEVAYVILRPTLDTALQRNGARSDGRSSDPSMIEQLYADFMNAGILEGNVIDTTNQTAETTANLIFERLVDGSLTLATTGAVDPTELISRPLTSPDVK